MINIIQGWKNYLFENEEVEQIAKDRAAICQGCDSAVMGSYEQILPDFSIKEIKGLKCKECGCPLSTKLRALNEKCDLGKWDSMN